MIGSMTVHITEAGPARDIHAVLARVQRGDEIVVQQENRPVAIVKAASAPRRTISECIALLPPDSTATIDERFADDVEAAIAAHREALVPPAWD
jgi:antitoxin (DNA-binding transcriptional repressor) of toxin-antitoxin stability system